MGKSTGAKLGGGGLGSRNPHDFEMIFLLITHIGPFLIALRINSIK